MFTLSHKMLGTGMWSLLYPAISRSRSVEHLLGMRFIRGNEFILPLKTNGTAEYVPTCGWCVQLGEIAEGSTCGWHIRLKIMWETAAG